MRQSVQFLPEQRGWLGCFGHWLQLTGNNKSVAKHIFQRAVKRKRSSLLGLSHHRNVNSNASSFMYCCTHMSSLGPILELVRKSTRPIRTHHLRRFLHCANAALWAMSRRISTSGTCCNPSCCAHWLVHHHGMGFSHKPRRPFCRFACMSYAYISFLLPHFGSTSLTALKSLIDKHSTTHMQRSVL